MLAALVLGMILGPIAETNFRRALIISDDSIDIFIESEIVLAIFVLTVLSMLAPMVARFRDTIDLDAIR